MSEQIIKWIPPQAKRMQREAERLLAEAEKETLYVSSNGSTFRYRNGERQPVPKSMLPLRVKRQARMLSAMDARNAIARAESTPHTEEA